MKPLGTKPMNSHCGSIDNWSWGKRKLNSPQKAFYAMDYDLFDKNGSKKSARQQAKREILKELNEMGGDTI